MGKQSKVDADRAKAEKRLEQEIGAGQTEEQLARAEKKAEGMGRGVNKGEEQLFEKKLTKEEKKAAMEIKKAEIAAKKAAKKAAAEGGDEAAEGDDGDGDGDGDGGDEERSASPSKSKKGAAGAVVAAEGDMASLTLEQQRVAAARAVTGVLASHAAALDVKIASFSISVGGNQLLNDCDLELNQGCRYGLIGENGSGKSNVLAAIAQRDIPLPAHVDVFHLHEEAPATEMTGVEAVINHATLEAARLEALSEQIIEESGPEDERLQAINDRLDELDPTGAEPRARKILSGLGFADHLVPMDRQTKHMSGGWRMRVSLAQALFAAPSLLLLDEPTNHLDLEACVWLEEHLSRYSKCLLVISHSQDFLNAVCTNTVWLNRSVLSYYTGNYDTFCKVVSNQEQVQMREYEKQQADMEKLATFVRVNKANGVAASAKSKKKVLEKLDPTPNPSPHPYPLTLAPTPSP